MKPFEKWLEAWVYKPPNMTKREKFVAEAAFIAGSIMSTARREPIAPDLLEVLDYIRGELRAAQAYICQPKEIETWLDDMEKRANDAFAKARGEDVPA